MATAWQGHPCEACVSASPEQPKKPTRKDLQHKQNLFVEAYLGEARGNGAKAARMAGYEFPAEEAYRLLRKAHIRARINERLAEAAMTANEVLAELSDIGRSEWRDFIEILERDDEGKPIRVRMDLSAKVKSLELIGKHHQLFTDNVALSGGIDIEIVGVDVEKL